MPLEEEDFDIKIDNNGADPKWSSRKYKMTSNLLLIWVLDHFSGNVNAPAVSIMLTLNWS